MRSILSKVKILFFIVIVNFILFNFSVCEATINPVEHPDDYKPDPITSAGKVKTIGNTIIGGIQFVGTIISVIVLICIGIKFIYGSAEERAEYKESLKPYLIGAIMLFSTTNILAIISELF